MTGEDAIIEMMERKRFNTRPSAKLYRKELMEGIRFPFDLVHCDAATIYKIFASARRVSFGGVVKYLYNRHDGMTTAWTKDHSNLTPLILDELNEIHRRRTEWLCEQFPERTKQFLYYELAFDISMVEKINRYNLVKCEPQLKMLMEKLHRYQDEFMGSKWLKDFEKEWMERYVL